jgi:regulatory protein
MKAKPLNATARSEPRSPRKITPDYLRNAGLYYLERYSASTYKFRTIMLRKITKSITHHHAPTVNEAETWLEKVIEDFTRLGYLNDQNYADNYIKSLREKGYSSRKISMKLTEKGLQISLHDEIDDLNQLLRHMKRKRLGVFASKEKDPQKLLANLARQGFSFATCQTALSMTIDDIESYLTN